MTMGACQLWLGFHQVCGHGFNSSQARASRRANYKQADHNRAINILKLHLICHFSCVWIQSCKMCVETFYKKHQILSMAASAWSARLLGMYLDKAFSGCPLFVIIYMISEDIYQNYYLKIKMLIDWLVGHSKPDDFCALAQRNCIWILTLDFFQISNGKSEKSKSSLKIQMRFQKGLDPIVQCLPCLLEFLCPANLPNH